MPLTNRDASIVAAAEEVLSLFFEWERGGGMAARIALRSAAMRLSVARRRQRNEAIGRTPYGFKKANGGRGLSPDEDEQRAIRVMVALRKDGLSLAQVTRQMTAEGFKNRGGKPWNRNAVHCILRGCQSRVLTF